MLSALIYSSSRGPNSHLAAPVSAFRRWGSICTNACWSPQAPGCASLGHVTVVVRRRAPPAVGPHTQSAHWQENVSSQAPRQHKLQPAGWRSRFYYSPIPGWLPPILATLFPLYKIPFPSLLSISIQALCQVPAYSLPPPGSFP